MPDQLRSFDDFNLTDQVSLALEEMGFETPSEVQSASFEPILEGKDIAVQARTGTGKTAAFAIPLADRLLSQEPKVQMLVLCPTRELALQVAGEFSSIAKHRGLLVAPVYGGAAISKQIRQLDEGVHAVVGTPGRVLDHIRRRTLALEDIRYLVLDEADEMLSMGFEREISAIIEQLPQQRQTMLFSATIPSEIQRLSQRYMKEPTILSLSDDYVGAKEIEHAFYMVSGTGRLADLVRIIDVEGPDSALVFCNTRDDVQMVANGLKRHGFNVEWISSDLSQNEREAAMGRMRGSDVRFLVATDVAARGIDISHVTHVINYTFPESLEVYIHRTGRTGRMGKTGWALSLITPRDVGNLYFLKLQYRITPLERELPTQGEADARQESDLLAKLLSHRTDGSPNEVFLSLARRMQQHVRGTEIMASLIEQVLGPIESTEAESARRRRPGRPRPKAEQERSEPETKRTRSPQRTRPERSEPVEEGAPPTPPTEPPTHPTEPSPPEEDAPVDTIGDETVEMEAPLFKEIYVSVGRRNGARASDIARFLNDGGISDDQIDRIRIRDRSTFVSVLADLTDKAVDALNGARFGSREATAELAKRERT